MPSSKSPARSTGGGAFGEDKGNLHGIMVMQVAVFLFATNDTLTKLIGSDLPAGQIGFYRCIMALVPLAFACIITGQYRHYRQAVGRMVLLRGNFEGIASIVLLVALPNLPLANYTSFILTIPLLATAIAAIFLGSAVGIRRWSAIFVGLAGVMFIVRPGLEGYNVFSVVALVGISFAAGRDLSTRYLPKGSALWIVTTSTMVISALYAFAYGFTEDWQPITTYHFSILLLSALLMTVGQAALMVAMNHGEFPVVAPFRYVSILFALFYGYILWHEIPDTLTWIGIFLILAAGIYTILRERKVAKQRARDLATQGKDPT